MAAAIGFKFFFLTEKWNWHQQVCFPAQARVATATCHSSHTAVRANIFLFLKTPPPLLQFLETAHQPSLPRHSHGTLNRERPVPFPHHTHTKPPSHNHRPAHPHTSGRRHPTTAAAHNPSCTTHSSAPPVPTYRSTNPFPHTNPFRPHCSNQKTLSARNPNTNPSPSPSPNDFSCHQRKVLTCNFFILILQPKRNYDVTHKTVFG